jgi:hypothetical protein
MRKLAYPVYQVSSDIVGRAAQVQIALLLSLPLMGNNTVKSDSLKGCDDA